MTDEILIWVGLAAAILLVVIEPRVAKVAWFILKIILFLAIAASMIFGIGFLGIVLIGVISRLLGGRGKK